MLTPHQPREEPHPARAHTLRQFRGSRGKTIQAVLLRGDAAVVWS